jgi:hypothetical protein
MESNTLHSIRTWLSFFPESCHPMDMRRFYEFISTAADNGDLNNVCAMNHEYEVRRCQPKWNDEFVTEFVDEWQTKIEIVAGYAQHLAESQKL